MDLLPNGRRRRIFGKSIKHPRTFYHRYKRPSVYRTLTVKASEMPIHPVAAATPVQPPREASAGRSSGRRPVSVVNDVPIEVDSSDDDDDEGATALPVKIALPSLPDLPDDPAWNELLSRPITRARLIHNEKILNLSWDLMSNEAVNSIVCYQFIVHRFSIAAKGAQYNKWQEMAIIDAVPLPMACAIGCLVPGETYHFSLRAVDNHGNFGSFSKPCCVKIPSTI